MNKKIIYCIAIICLILISFIAYKGFNLYKYNNSNNDIKRLYKGLKIKDTLTIKNEPAEDYITLQDIKIENVFKDFEKIIDSKDLVAYAIGETETEKETYFFLGIDKTLLDLIKDSKIKGFDSFLKRNEIKNDVEYLKYAISKKNKHNNIFTSIKTMEDRYMASNVLELIAPSFDSITLIEGDYEGYILNNKNNYQVYILKNGKRYNLTFNDTDYFTDDYIKLIINSIVIEKEN